MMLFQKDDFSPDAMTSLQDEKKTSFTTSNIKMQECVFYINYRTQQDHVMTLVFSSI